MTKARWIKTVLGATLALLTWQTAQAENFYLSAGVGRVRAPGIGDGTVSFHMVAGMPLDYNMSVEIEHIEALDVGSWFNDKTDVPGRLFSSHTGAAGVWYWRPNPGVRLQARLGLGTTVQVGSDSSVGDARIWELEPGVGVLILLHPSLQVGLETSHFWRSKTNILALTGRWSF